MYRVDPFMEHAKKFLKPKVKSKAIDKVRETRHRDDEKLVESSPFAEIVKQAALFENKYPENYIREMMEQANRAKKLIEGVEGSDPETNDE